MNYASINRQKERFYEFAADLGFDTNVFLTKENLKDYISTSVDAYREYPLFVDMFGGHYDEKALYNMMMVDFGSKLQKMAGIASSPDFEAILLIEPPNRCKEFFLQYVKVARLKDYEMLLKPSTYRQDAYENFARKKRKIYMDDNTWYIYVFATRQALQRQGYGKKLMQCATEFAKKYGYRICLETNHKANVGMYEQFGFELKDTSKYRRTLDHYVMLYE